MAPFTPLIKRTQIETNTKMAITLPYDLGGRPCVKIMKTLDELHPMESSIQLYL
jgi:hypothetical protein